MRHSIKDAIKGGVILFIILNIPLFLLGLWLNNKLLVINFDFTTITPYIYIGLPILGAIVFYIGGKSQAKRRRHISVGLVSPPPNHVFGQITFSHFGVNWRVQVGAHHRFSDDRDFYAESCHCPGCDTELMTAEKDTLLGWGTRLFWRCPRCNFEQIRPKDFLRREDESVENIARREYERMVRDGEVDF